MTGSYDLPDPAQPTFATVGAASNATFDVKLDTRVRADAVGKVRMKVWPTISAEDVDVDFSLHSSNVDLELNGEMPGAAGGATRH